MKCSACGSENPEGKRFCGDCGVALAPTRAYAGAKAKDDGERRHLTVLFSDLVGSTEIAAKLDPEDWRDIAARYQAAVAAAVERHGGFVAQFLGDGVVAYFGWPTAHEDDGDRAVRAGLAVVETVCDLNDAETGAKGLTLAVRVGIDSGSVVVGTGPTGEVNVFGEVPNIAARAQSQAAPDTVIITDAVRDLLKARFVSEDLGTPALKGVSRPVRLHRIASLAQGNFERGRPGGRGATSFVGRDREMQLVLDEWARARGGEGRVVLVTGDPGMGKSRLIEEFRAAVSADAPIWVEGAGERYFEATPFYAVVQMLEHAIGHRRSRDDAIWAANLEEALTDSGLNKPETKALIAELVGITLSGASDGAGTDAFQKRWRLISTLASWVQILSKSQPVVLVLEDLHWVDPSTLEFLETLASTMRASAVLILLTARPEFHPTWSAVMDELRIPLERLSDAQTRDLIQGFSSHVSLSPSVVEKLIARTDGIPLFAEELTRLMLDAGRHGDGGAIPATLHDLLAARLDSLDGGREIAQVAAVIGREFAFDLVATVADKPEAEMLAALARLVEADLIVARGSPPFATYQFRHALVRDAAYEGLLRSRRRAIHAVVARTLV